MSSISDFWNFDFLLYALVATLFLSVLCGALSPLVLARKQAFMGAAISHSTFLGLSIGLSIVGANNPKGLFLITLVITVFLALFLAMSTYRENLPADGLIGIFFTTCMGAGIIIHHLFANGQGDLLGFLFGNILLLSNFDLIIIILLTFFGVGTVFLYFKKWIYTTYDEEGALVSGVNLKFYHYLFFILISMVIVSSLKLAGAVLINTLLLVPGIFGMKLGRSLKQVFSYSIIFSTLTSLTGLILANAYDLPSGASIAVFQFLILILALILKKVF